jgi:hypothetical protein
MRIESFPTSIVQEVVDLHLPVKVLQEQAWDTIRGAVARWWEHGILAARPPTHGTRRQAAARSVRNTAGSCKNESRDWVAERTPHRIYV